MLVVATITIEKATTNVRDGDCGFVVVGDGSTLSH